MNPRNIILFPPLARSEDAVPEAVEGAAGAVELTPIEAVNVGAGTTANSVDEDDPGPSAA